MHWQLVADLAGPISDGTQQGYHRSYLNWFLTRSTPSRNFEAVKFDNAQSFINPDEVDQVSTRRKGIEKHLDTNKSMEDPMEQPKKAGYLWAWVPMKSFRAPTFSVPVHPFAPVGAQLNSHTILK
jgi:hypothetical protein